MARLDIYKNMQVYVQVKMERESVLIGRGEQCDIILVDTTVSRSHLRLSKTGDRFLLENYSQNGTRLNSSMVSTPTECKLGDRIYLGDFAIILKADGDPLEDVNTVKTICISNQGSD